jgi:anti-sigma factor RsiW
MRDEERKRDELLQRYFDGELTAEERAAVEASMTPEDELRLAALAEMRALLGAALDGSAADIDLLPAIDAQLKTPHVTASPPANGATATAAAPVDELAKRREAGRSRGVRTWIATAMATALAAGFLVIAKPWQGGPLVTDSEIEDLETEGAVVASIFKVGGESDKHQATVIWTHDDDDDDDDEEEED